MGMARGEPTEFYTQDMRPEANISWIEHKNLSKQKGYERGHGHTRQLVCGCPFFATRVSDSKLFSSYHHRLPQKLDVTSGELVSKGKHDLTDGNNARDQSPFFSRRFLLGRNGDEYSLLLPSRREPSAERGCVHGCRQLLLLHISRHLLRSPTLTVHATGTVRVDAILADARP